jgi:hypothetical protein
MANCCENLQLLSIGSVICTKIYLAQSGNWRGCDVQIAQLGNHSMAQGPSDFFLQSSKRLAGCKFLISTQPN